VSARISADFLIIGSGVAGLRAAVSLAPYGRVHILTKDVPDAGSTTYAQGGIAAAFGDDDSTSLHAADTIAAGAGLADELAVATLVGDGKRRVQELLDWGAAFDRDADGRPALAREGAHSVRRVLHARDATGREIARVLAERIRDRPSVTVTDHATVVQLVADRQGVRGLRFLDRNGRLQIADADAVLLATGGAGQMYRETTNPAVATGDGIALAYLAGARVADLEFVQFHPTALAVSGTPRYLLSEALRGEGAALVNRAGERFMTRYDPAGELAPRDRVARAIATESARTSAPVYLRMSHLDPDVVRARFPQVTELCRRAGLDLAIDPIPVAPAAHYLMGGVLTDQDGRTTVPNLYAAGEVACTGVHGANRLASNSLLEGLVFGARAGEAMHAGTPRSWPAATPALVDAPPQGEPFTVSMAESHLRALMWQAAGLFRDRPGLQAAAETLDTAWRDIAQARADGRSLTSDSWRVSSLVMVGRLVVRAALRREESRGAHSRTDFPERDDLHWKRRLTEVRTSVGVETASL
jgi:L-aspartate oxidase